jgi:hypothetical protein
MNDRNYVIPSIFGATIIHVYGVNVIVAFDITCSG